jgi:hypothetical protein
MVPSKIWRRVAHVKNRHHNLLGEKTQIQEDSVLHFNLTICEGLSYTLLLRSYFKSVRRLEVGGRFSQFSLHLLYFALI